MSELLLSEIGVELPFLFFLFFLISTVAAAGLLVRAVLVVDVVLGSEGSLRGILVPFLTCGGVGCRAELAVMVVIVGGGGIHSWVKWC